VKYVAILLAKLFHRARLRLKKLGIDKKKEEWRDRGKKYGVRSIARN